MAGLSIGKISLKDNWPGPVNPALGVPDDGWDGTTHSCVTSPVYPIGTKIMAYSDASTNPGWYTMAYAEVASMCGGEIAGNGGPEGDCSDGLLWVAHCCLTQPAGDLTYKITTHDGSMPPPTYVVAACYSSDSIDVTKGTARIGLACATASGYEHIWMWVGGVCPVQDVSLFRGAADVSDGIDITITTNITSRQFHVVDTTAAGLVFSTCPTDAAMLVDGTWDGATTHCGWVDGS